MKTSGTGRCVKWGQSGGTRHLNCGVRADSVVSVRMDWNCGMFSQNPESGRTGHPCGKIILIWHGKGCE